MSKVSRQFTELLFSALNSLRAEDIPYDASDSIKAKVDSLGGGGLPALAPGRASQWGTLQVSPSNPFGLDGVGLLQSTSYQDTSSSIITSADGPYLSQVAGATRWISAAAKMRADNNPLCVVKMKYDADADSYFFGFSEGASINNVDDPPGKFCGVYFRPTRDTNFQLMTKDGTTQTLIDTGIAPVADDVYYFNVSLDITNTLATLSVYDKDYALLASVTTALTLPAASITLFLMHDVIGTAADLKTFLAHLITRSA